MEDGRVVDYFIADTGVDPMSNAMAVLKDRKYDALTATGYGRHLLRERLHCPVITEIKAYATGAHFLCPSVRTVVDIGGQDTKVISVNEGKVADFEMNDRCAAGTGKFLEVMAHSLGFSVDTFGQNALRGKDVISINSMCTVFAESEVISLIARGEDRGNIALSLHHSVLSRLMSMISRVGFSDNIVFAGGVAKNPCMVEILSKKLDRKLFIPEEPQIVGATGAALEQKGRR
jgi:predicted CoA-substrate-specific enzyme activase